MANFFNRVCRGLSTNEYQPGSEVRMTGGNDTMTSTGSGFASKTVSHNMGLTPDRVHVTAHEGSTLATVQSWNATTFTATLAKTNGTNLGTVGFSWTAISG